MKDNLLQFCLILLSWQLSVAEESCCKDILLDVADKESDVHILQGGRLGFYKKIGLYGGKSQYKQVDGDNYMFFSAKESLWLTSSNVGNTSTGITSNYTGDCIDSTSEWQYYNGSDWKTHKNLTAKCAEIGDTCCKNIEMSSANGTITKDNSSSLVFAEEARLTLGKYTAVGTITGRYIYQHQNMDRYLQFEKTNMNWLVVHQVGSISGYIYHKGGSVCAENSGDQWHVASLQNKNTTTTSWQHDPHFKVKCVQDKQVNTTTTISTPEKEVDAETTPGSLSSSSTKVDSTESSSSVTEENAQAPLAKPLVSDSENAGSPVTAIIVSLGFLVVFTVLAVILVHRFRTSWRSGSHGKQLVMETFGLHRNNI